MTTMDENVLGDLGLNDVSDDPNDTPDGLYKAVVHEVKIFIHNSKPAGQNRFLIITYRIVDPQYPNLKDNTIDEWKSANKGDTPKQKSFLKARLLSLGLDKADVDAGRLNFKAMCGIPVNITVKNKDGYTNVNKVVLADDKGWNTPASGQPQMSGQSMQQAVSGGNSTTNAGGIDF